MSHDFTPGDFDQALARSQRMRRAMTLTGDGIGDATITWTEDSDDKMIAFIEKKMTEGVTFFLIEPRFEGGVIEMGKGAELKPGDDLSKRAVMIPDEHLKALLDLGAVQIVKTPPKRARATRTSKDAKEIAKSESVAVKPLKGG